MLRRGAERLIDSGAVSPDRLRRMDDHALLVTLRECDRTAEIARRLDQRDLLKRAVWAELDSVPAAVLGADNEKRREMEREIAATAGVDPDGVVLDIPPEPEMAESTSRVLVNGQVRALGAQSTLVRALRAAQRDQWRLGVYASDAEAEQVGDAALRTLGLELEGTLVRDVRTGINTTLDEFE